MDVRSVASLLSMVEPFSALDESTIDGIAHRARQMRVVKDQVVFHEQESSDGQMFVLAEGCVRLIVRSPRGEIVELVRHQPPALFGELSVLDGGCRTATAEMVERGMLIVVKRDDLLQASRPDQQVVDALLRFLGDMVRRTTEQVSDLAFVDLEGRVARQLVRLAEPAQDGIWTVQVKQAELGHMVVGSRQGVNDALGALQRRGLIRRGRTIRLLDIDSLRTHRSGQWPT
jgi:CRP/FNR family transcriptional regulator, cyclic AMP receptor protein